MARYFPISGTKYQWNQSRKRVLIVQALLYNQRDWQFIFSLQDLGISSSTDKGVLIRNLLYSAQNRRVSLSFPALNLLPLGQQNWLLLLSWHFLSQTSLKLSDHPLQALNSPTLDLSPFFSFCCHIKRLHFFSNHIKVYRYAFLITFLHSHKGTFWIWSKKILHKKMQGFCDCWYSCSDGFMNFLFFTMALMLASYI